MKRLSFCVGRLLLEQALLDLAMIEFTSLSFRFCDLTMVEKLPVQIIPDTAVIQLNLDFFLAICLNGFITSSASALRLNEKKLRSDFCIFFNVSSFNKNQKKKS